MRWSGKASLQNKDLKEAGKERGPQWKPPVQGPCGGSGPDVLLKQPGLFLPGCLKIDHHHEQHSNCPDQEVRGQQTTSAETDGPQCPSPWEGSSTQDRNGRKTSQDVQDPTRCHLGVWIQNPFGGGKTTGFGMIHDSLDHAKKVNPNTDVRDMACVRGDLKNTERNPGAE